MNESISAQFRSEGQPAFPTEPEKDNSAAPPAEETTVEPAPSSQEPDKVETQPPEKPFNEHPRWQEREKEWDKRFNTQEERHQEDLKKLREEFGDKRQENAEQTKIPSWFGGDQEQWDAYRKDRDTEIAAAEERALKRLTAESSAEEKAIQDATDYFKTALTEIESDKELNPNGLKVDPNKLLKIVMDRDLIDSKGRWNYKAGFEIYKAQSGSTKNTEEKKKLAAASSSDGKGDPKPSAFKTAADFKQPGARPW